MNNVRLTETLKLVMQYTNSQILILQNLQVSRSFHLIIVFSRIKFMYGKKVKSVEKSAFYVAEQTSMLLQSLSIREALMVILSLPIC